MDKELEDKLIELFTLEYFNHKSINDRWKYFIKHKELQDDKYLHDKDFIDTNDETRFIRATSNSLIYYKLKELYKQNIIRNDIDFQINEKEINTFIDSFEYNEDNIKLIEELPSINSLYNASIDYFDEYVLIRTKLLIKAKDFNKEEIKINNIIHTFKESMNLGNTWAKEINKILEKKTIEVYDYF